MSGFNNKKNRCNNMCSYYSHCLSVCSIGLKSLQRHSESLVKVYFTAKLRVIPIRRFSKIDEIQYKLPPC